MINVSMPKIETELKPRITVFGVGGAGGNAINNMIRANLEGVDFVVGNTDAQALEQSLAQKKLQLGTTITRGLGAGSRPDVGRAAAEEQIDEIMTFLDGANMVFITAGMGGGTGTGAAPVIARAARERGILTVGVVTKPFHFEGGHRMRLADSGIGELQQYVDTLIIIPNQNLFRVANEKTTFSDAFKMADDVLYAGVRGVTDLMVMPGLINLDFADIRSVMTEMGKAMMGTGEASGERRAVEAAEAAISNPLLDDVSMKGARGVLINITGGLDMTLFEVDEAANRIRDEVDPEANIIFGSTFDESMEGTMRVSVVATGIDAQSVPRPQPSLSLVAGGKVAGAAGPRPVDYHASLVAAPLPPGAVAGNTAVAIAQPVAETELSQGRAEPAGDAAVKPLVGQAETAEAAVAPSANRTAALDAPMDRPTGGSLRGERRDGHFIAPRPVDVGARTGAAMARADVLSANGKADDQARRRPGSLFERVTGLNVGRRRDEAPSTDVAPVAPAAAPAAKPPVETAAEGRDRAKRTSGEEDVLDIPAFLRRQAN